MLKTANIHTRATREHCFKDLKVSELSEMKFFKGSKQGHFKVKLKSWVRHFEWDNPFTFKTRTLEEVLKQEAANIPTQRNILSKYNMNGLFYIRDTNTLVLVVNDLKDIAVGNPIELARTCIEPYMYKYDVIAKTITVKHCYVNGVINILFRK